MWTYTAYVSLHFLEVRVLIQQTYFSYVVHFGDNNQRRAQLVNRSRGNVRKNPEKRPGLATAGTGTGRSSLF